MNLVLLAVPSRPAGWRGNETIPLLTPLEVEAHSALVGAGFPVEVVPEEAVGLVTPARSVLLVGVGLPEERMNQLVEAFPAGGIKILCVEEVALPPLRTRSWRRRITMNNRTFCLSRRGRHARRNSMRGRFAFSLGHRLRPTPTSTVIAQWGEKRGVALLKDKIGSAEVWRAGFSLDRLAPAHLIEIVAAIAADVRPVLKPPLPEGRQAVVMLIHDVEEALPDDPRGLLSVRRGTEACLEAEARQGFRATYNLVGDFGPMIGDLGRRMVAEGHEVASHGLSHRVMADLSEADVRSEVKGSEDRIRGITGIEIQGFRSPRSRWSGSLLKVLSEKGYLWNAEADDSPYPYPIPLDDAGRVIRLPVAADDWDFVKRNASPRAVLKLWQREVRSAMERGAWIALGSHPSVLGVHPERTETFRDFLAWLADQEVKIMTAGEGAAWWRSRTWDQNSATSFPRNQIRANRE